MLEKGWNIEKKVTIRIMKKSRSHWHVKEHRCWLNVMERPRFVLRFVSMKLQITTFRPSQFLLFQTRFIRLYSLIKTSSDKIAKKSEQKNLSKSFDNQFT